MRAHTRFSITVIAAAAAFAVGARADAPNIYAIRGARLVTAAGAPIQSGTIVIRNGVIDAVGADVQPPADAFIIDGAGMTVYPGLINMGNSTGMDIQPNPNPPGTFRTSEDQERWKRSVIFRPEMVAADHLQADAPELSRYASAGVTTVLAIPPGSLVKGQSALVNVAAPADEPQIGAVADTRKGLQVVRTPVALHVALNASGGRGGYPASLMGSIAFVRQHFLDAQHQQLAQQQYERSKTGGEPSLTRRVAGCAAAGARAPVAGRVRGGSFPRDSALAEHGQGVQPGSDDHRRGRGGPGRRRPQGTERAGHLQPQLPGPVARASAGR